MYNASQNLRHACSWENFKLNKSATKLFSNGKQNSCFKCVTLTIICNFQSMQEIGRKILNKTKVQQNFLNGK
jgi:hypothetical protein